MVSCNVSYENRSAPPDEVGRTLTAVGEIEPVLGTTGLATDTMAQLSKRERAAKIHHDLFELWLMLGRAKVWKSKTRMSRRSIYVPLALWDQSLSDAADRAPLPHDDCIQIIGS